VGGGVAVSAYSRTSAPCPHDASLTWTTETWTDRAGNVTRQTRTETKDVVGADGRVTRVVVDTKCFARIKGYSQQRTNKGEA